MKRKNRSTLVYAYGIRSKAGIERTTITFSEKGEAWKSKIPFPGIDQRRVSA